MRAIDSLKTLFAPFLPFTSQLLHTYLGYDSQLFGQSHTSEFNEAAGRVHKVLCYDATDAIGEWKASALPAGQELRKPKPLFAKLDDDLAEQERSRLEEQRSA